MWNIMTTWKYPLVDTQSLGHALSTIRSPVFSEVRVLYQDIDIPNLQYQWHGPPLFDGLTSAKVAEVDSKVHMVFEVLREMWRVHNFTLVLCADVWGCVMEYAVQELKRAVWRECTEEKLNGTSSQVLVTFQPREFHPTGDKIHLFVGFSKWVHPWTPKFIE